MLNWSIENAQKKVEQQNFSIRKRLLQFDDVLNTQREVIYSIRNDAITSDAPRAIVMEMVTEEIEERYQSAMANQSAEDMESFVSWVNAYFPISLSLEQLNEKEGEAESFILESIKKAYDERETFEDIESLKGL